MNVYEFHVHNYIYIHITDDDDNNNTARWVDAHIHAEARAQTTGRMEFEK